MTHTEKAGKLFKEKFHCSQAVLAAFAEEIGLTEQQALKLGGCFGSGMRRGEVCGACIGALMVLGMKYGQYEVEDVESRLTCNGITEAFLEAFRQENGSYLCNELLNSDMTTESGRAYAREHKLFTEFCPKMVSSAVRITEQFLKGD